MLKILGKIVLTIAAIAVCGVICGVAWIMYSPRESAFLNDKISERLDSVSDTLTTRAGRTVIQWDGGDELIGLHIKNITVTNQQGHVVANVPDIAVRLKLLYLLVGEVAIESMRITQPEIILPQAPVTQEPYYQVSSTSSASSPLIASILSNFDPRLIQSLLKTPLEFAEVVNGSLTFSNQGQEYRYLMPSARVTINRDNPEQPVVLTASIANPVSGEESPLRIAAGIHDDDVVLSFSVRDLFINDLISLMPGFDNWLNVPVRLQGEVHAWFENMQQFSRMDFAFTAVEQQQFQLNVEGEFTPAPPGSDAPLMGKVYIEVPEIESAFVIQHWPGNLALNTKEWIAENIRQGKLHNVFLQLNLSPEAARGEANMVEGAFRIADVVMYAVPGMEPFKGLKGAAWFDEHSMHFTVDEGFMYQTRLHGKVVLEGLSEDNERIRIDVASEGTIEDLQPMLTLLDRSEPAEEGAAAPKQKDGVNLATVTGFAQLQHNYQFPLLKELAFSQIDFAINGNVTNVTVPNVFNGLPLEQGGFDLTIDGTKVALKGEAVLGPAPGKMEWKSAYSSSEKFTDTVWLHLTMDAADLKQFGLDTDGELQGTIYPMLNIQSGEKAWRAEGKVSLQDARFELKPLGWSKEYGQESELQFTASDSDAAKAISLSNLLLTGPDMAIAGSGSVEKSGAETVHLKLDNIVSKKSDFSATVAHSEAQGADVVVEGKSFDARPLLASLNVGESTPAAAAPGAKPEDKEKFALKVKVDSMFMANGIVMQAVSGSMNCNEAICTHLDYKGKFTAKDTVDISLRPHQGGYLLNAVSNDGGKMLKGLDIYENIVGGKISTNASSDTGMRYDGRLIMQDFKVVKAPAMAKLLTIASFTGIVNILNGEGIQFDRLKGNYSYENDKLILTDVKASGSSLAITVSGEIDFAKNELRLQGNVVPATLLNNVLESVPFFGSLLTQGGEESLIATRYTMVGPISDPDVTVNPLSILTPGFLRNIWGDVLD